jgi:hypothetical protein
VKSIIAACSPTAGTNPAVVMPAPLAALCSRYINSTASETGVATGLGTNLPISNVRFDGEYRRQSGQHMLNSSSSPFDPKEKWRQKS